VTLATGSRAVTHHGELDFFLKMPCSMRSDQPRGRSCAKSLVLGLMEAPRNQDGEMAFCR